MNSKELLPAKQKQDPKSFLPPIPCLKLISVQKKNNKKREIKFKVFGSRLLCVFQTQTPSPLTCSSLSFLIAETPHPTWEPHLSIFQWWELHS